MNDQSYLREELEALSTNARPTKGEVCLKCGSHIPQFKDLGKEDEERLRMFAESNAMRAINELRRLTGCPLSFAKYGGFIHTVRATKTVRLHALSAGSLCERAKQSSVVIASMTGTIQTT